MTTSNSMCYLPCWGDYILIGEEVFAAQAYISKDAIQIGKLVTGDIFRFAFIALIVLGAVLTTFGVKILTDFLK